MSKNLARLFITGGRGPSQEIPLKQSRKKQHYKQHQEDAPIREPMRVRAPNVWYDRDTYRFNIIKNFLDSNIGQHWDDVLSKACEHCDRRTFETHQFKHYLRSQINYSYLWFKETYYLDKNNILRKKTDTKHKKINTLFQFNYDQKKYIINYNVYLKLLNTYDFNALEYDYSIYIDKDNSYQKINGIWYHVNTENIVVYKWYPDCGYIQTTTSQFVKKQLGKKQLKKLKLKNHKAVVVKVDKHGNEYSTRKNWPGVRERKRTN